jgi:hypothetical protein
MGRAFVLYLCGRGRGGGGANETTGPYLTLTNDDVPDRVTGSRQNTVRLEDQEVIQQATPIEYTSLKGLALTTAYTYDVCTNRQIQVLKEQTKPTDR